MRVVANSKQQRGSRIWGSIVVLIGAMVGFLSVCVACTSGQLWGLGPLLDLLVGLIVLPPIVFAVVLVDIACSHLRKAPLWIDTNPFWKGIAVGLTTIVLDRRLHILAVFDPLLNGLLR
jgi:hypothetical protein